MWRISQIWPHEILERFDQDEINWVWFHHLEKSLYAQRDVNKNDEFCMKSEELCMKNEEFCIKNDELCRSQSRSTGSKGEPRGLHL